MLLNIVYESSVTHFYYYILYELHFEDVTFVCNLFFDVVFEHLHVFRLILEFGLASTMYCTCTVHTVIFIKLIIIYKSKRYKDVQGENFSFFVKYLSKIQSQMYILYEFMPVENLEVIDDEKEKEFLIGLTNTVQ